MPLELMRSFPLRETIAAILRGTFDRQQISRFIALCHAMAQTKLERKFSLGQLHSSIIGLPISDLAMDCIADLFRMDEDGTPVRIHAYFSGVDIRTLPHEQLMILVSRLVFSSVNSSLFRVYNEADPALGRIIRNIKLCLGSLGIYTESERFGDTILTPTLANPLTERPPLDRESLGRVMQYLDLANDTVPTMLSGLSFFLRGQSEYARSVPLTMVALAFRDYLSSLNPSTRDATNEAETTLAHQDRDLVLRHAVERLRKRMRGTYVGFDELTEEEFDMLFAVVAEFLQKEAEGPTVNRSLFGTLAERVPGMNEEVYLKRYRNVLEYLLRLARKETRDALSVHLESA